MKREERWLVQEIKPGDQLRVKHLSIYHHGIYEGDGQVIHFAGPEATTLFDAKLARVRRDSLQDFALGGDIQVRAYSLWERLRKAGAKTILKRARARLGESGYDLLHNNCEHFSNLCAFSRAYSAQIDTLKELA